jgi:hypothetical protein
MSADDVNRLDAKWIGQFCRLEIPLQSVVNLRRVAEELRGLAFRLDQVFGRSDWCNAGGSARRVQDE